MRPSSSFVAAVALAASSTLACSAARPVDPEHAAPAPSAPATVAGANATASPSAPVPKPRIDKTQVVRGDSCAGYGRPFSAAHGKPAFTRRGDTWTSQEIKAGGGCPSRPPFTLAYAPKTIAGKTVLEAHVCEDVAADTCEMLMTGSISFALGAELAKEGATDVVFVDP